MTQLNKVFAGLILLVCLCGAAQGGPPDGRRVPGVGMILARGGLGDRSFNDSADQGLAEAQRLYGVRAERVTYSSDAANLGALRILARKGCNLIVGIGFENSGTMRELALEFPEQRLALIDAEAPGNNVASVLYREQEGDFLMGVLAALLTRSGKVGFVGGVDVPMMRRIEGGFRQGVAFQDPRVELISRFCGTFTDPRIGKAVALEQYGAGVDVIYNGAGRTGLGVVEAAGEKDRIVLGTSGDHRDLAPGHVAGHRQKRVDRAVLGLVEATLSGRFSGGTRSLGLKEGGLTMGPFDERIVTPGMLDRLKELERKIVAGGIVVR